jgi:FkbM family methyltransferase
MIHPAGYPGYELAMNAQLIYDVGAHLGEDTDFYLRKGFTVVAIEANPTLVQSLKERFRTSLSEGSLSLIEAAIAENSGEVDFYVNQANSVWGTIRPEWAERNARFDSPSKVVRIKAIAFSEVLGKYGVPYYVKIDVEGADLLCLEGLMSQPARPEFVSIESEKRSWSALLGEFAVFRKLGYTKFKIVDQTQVHLQRPPNPAAEGRDAEYRGEPGSSGLFGKELPGRWLTEREAIQRYRLIFVKYVLFGDYGMLRFLFRVPGFRRILKPAPWYDTHATI